MAAARLSRPTRSPGRYVRNLRGTAQDAVVMRAEGCADARSVKDAARHVVLLHIGAQTTKRLPSPGVLLSATATRLTYGRLVSARRGYLGGYAGCRPRSATGRLTVAVATNSDGDFVGYPAPSRAADWADRVVDPLRRTAGHLAGRPVTVAGGIDIEASFAATRRQAEAWIRAYLTKTPGNLIETGSADGCPTTLGRDRRSCGPVRSDGPHNARHTWTQADYYRLAHGLSPHRLRVLPQVYSAAQARQWANIATTGATARDHIRFLGSLTERAACGSACSVRPERGWSNLLEALSGDPRTRPTSLPIAVDLRVG